LIPVRRRVSEFFLVAYLLFLWRLTVGRRLGPYLL